MGRKLHQSAKTFFLGWNSTRKVVFDLFGANHLCKKVWHQSSTSTILQLTKKSTTSTTSRVFVKKQTSIFPFPPPKKKRPYRGIPYQAVTDIQLAFSSGDRRLGMARMLERLCGALELGEPRKVTQKVQKSVAVTLSLRLNMWYLCN